MEVEFKASVFAFVLYGYALFGISQNMWLIQTAVSVEVHVSASW